MATSNIVAGPGRLRESGVWQYFKYTIINTKTKLKLALIS